MTPNLMVAGMPNSGKTTFLIALRYLLMSDEIPTVLEQASLSDDETHFNNLEEKWLNAEQVGRTQRTSEAWVTLHVRDRKTRELANLVVPDLKGEYFEQPATKGLCPKTLYDALGACTAMLLFVNADDAADDLLISDVNAVVSALDGGQDGVNGQKAGTPEQVTATPTEKIFDPEEIPGDAKLVELLQMMNRRPLSAKLRRIAVIVSAWDQVPIGDGYTPDRWVREKHPMLAQFLSHNTILWESQFYGVSAQGGALPKDKAKLKGISKPSRRIVIVGQNVGDHDLTVPVQWLMGARKA